MAKKCLVCKKDLPEGSKLPLCEYHKGVATENAKKAGAGAVAVAATVAVTAKDTIGPIVIEKGLPAAKKALKYIPWP